MELAWSVNNDISSSVLVTEGVSSNDDGLSPSWHESGDVLDNDGFSENSSVQLVSDGAIGGLPHLLEVEFLDSGLIRGNGGALDTNLVLLDGMSCVNGHLIVSLVSVLNAEIVVLNIEIKIWVNVLFSVKQRFMLTFSLIHFQMILVISSPSSSTTGLATLIFWKEAKLLLAKANLEIMEDIKYLR